jgi:hypothetical protein
MQVSVEKVNALLDELWAQANEELNTEDVKTRLTTGTINVLELVKFTITQMESRAKLKMALIMYIKAEIARMSEVSSEE